MATSEWVSKGTKSLRGIPKGSALGRGAGAAPLPGVQRAAPSGYPSYTKLQSLSSSMGPVVSFWERRDSLTSPQSTPMVGSL